MGSVRLCHNIMVEGEILIEFDEKKFSLLVAGTLSLEVRVTQAICGTGWHRSVRGESDGVAIRSPCKANSSL